MPKKRKISKKTAKKQRKSRIPDTYKITIKRRGFAKPEEQYVSVGGKKVRVIARKKPKRA